MNKSYIRGSGRTIPGIPCIWVMWDSCLDSFPYVYQVSIRASSKKRLKCHIHYEGFLDLSIKNLSSPSTMPPTKDTHLCSYIPPTPSIHTLHHLPFHSPSNYPSVQWIVIQAYYMPSFITFKEQTLNKTVCPIGGYMSGCICSLSLSLMPGSYSRYLINAEWTKWSM